MRLWRRRDRPDARLDSLLDRLEQRLADLEDTVDLALGPDLVDDLAQRVGELSMTVPTQEDLLDLRLHTARVATDLARVSAELRASVDRMAAEVDDDVAGLDARVEALRTAVVDLTDSGSAERRAVLRRA